MNAQLRGAGATYGPSAYNGPKLWRTRPVADARASAVSWWDLP